MIKAQMNEFLYYALKKEEVTAQIDEDIGIDFIDFARTSSYMVTIQNEREERQTSMYVADIVAEYR